MLVVGLYCSVISNMGAWQKVMFVVCIVFFLFFVDLLWIRGPPHSTLFLFMLLFLFVLGERVDEARSPETLVLLFFFCFFFCFCFGGGRLGFRKQRFYFFFCTLLLWVTQRAPLCFLQFDVLIIVRSLSLLGSCFSLYFFLIPRFYCHVYLKSP